MNVYDEAHRLEAAIKESMEYKEYMKAKEKISENPELEEMLKDYQQKQLAVQGKQMLGEEVSNDMLQQIQNLYQIVAKDPLASEYLQCEMRFALMMHDVYKILGDLMGIGK